jgi:CRISPR-associated protein Cas1
LGTGENSALLAEFFLILILKASRSTPVSEVSSRAAGNFLNKEGSTMELIVEGRGAFIGKHQGRIRVTRAQQMVTEAPLIHLKRILVIDNGVSISSDVIRICCEEGIPIHFLDSRGSAFASLYSAGLVGTVMTRRAQLQAYETEVSVSLAKAFIAGKLQNQGNLLRYIAKYRKETNPVLYEELMLVASETQDFLHELANLKAGHIDDIREQILSVEGRASQCYWSAVARLIPAELRWPGRETRGALDSFNSALNYGYGILYCQVEQALTLAGLDPYGGYLHTDRPGKPSLVLDLIEEFRQAVVDRTIIALINKRVSLEQDKTQHLTEETRKRIAEKVLERLESNELYEKKRQALRCILQSQARHLALFLRGERPAYEPFIAGW